MSKTSSTRTEHPQPAMPAESVAAPPTPTAQIEAVLRAQETRKAAALDAEQPRLTTLAARAEAVRRRLQAQQAEYGGELNILAHRDYRKLHVLLGGRLAMELQEQATATRAVFEGRARAAGDIVDPSVYATLDRVARLIRQVTAADLHRCPPRPPGCGCLVAQIVSLIEDAESMPMAVTRGMANIRGLEERIASALKARNVDGLEEMAAPIPSAPPTDRRPSMQAATTFDPLN